MPANYPKRLGEKLRHIRDATRLAPDRFAPHVNTKDGDAVIAYENGEDMPVSVLISYAKFRNVPVENLINDNRDLVFGHVGELEFELRRRAKGL
jgi:hypothetical protein